MAYVAYTRNSPREQTVSYNGVIGNITHADVNKHTLDLAAALSETRKIISISISANRTAGTGEFYAFPNEGVTGGNSAFPYIWGKCVISNGTQRLQYNLSVANDVFSLYCFGYIVEA